LVQWLDVQPFSQPITLMQALVAAFEMNPASGSSIAHFCLVGSPPHSATAISATFAPATQGQRCA
jgi:hypothetical protein